LPEAVAAKLVAPTIESKPLTDFVDRRLEVLVSLLERKATRRVHGAERSSRLDPHRFNLMSSRLDAAIARPRRVDNV
jgi:hypothetical protein